MARKGLLAGFVITQDTTLDFMKMTDNRGVLHLSLKNQGTASLIIDDFSQEEIKPDEMFVVESPVSICNTSFRLKFRETAAGTEKFVICRYIVENECFTNNNK